MRYSDGVGSPITQTFGLARVRSGGRGGNGGAGIVLLGLRGRDSARDQPPGGRVVVASRLADRGYRPIEFTTILVRPTSIAWPGGEHVGDDPPDRARRGGPLGIAYSAEGKGRDRGDRGIRARAWRRRGPQRNGSICFLAELGSASPSVPPPWAFPNGSGPPGRCQHDPIGPQYARAQGALLRARLRAARRSRMRPHDDGGPAGEHVAEERGTARISDRVYSRQVGRPARPRMTPRPDDAGRGLRLIAMRRPSVLRSRLARCLLALSTRSRNRRLPPRLTHQGYQGHGRQERHDAKSERKPARSSTTIEVTLGTWGGDPPGRPAAAAR